MSAAAAVASDVSRKLAVPPAVSGSFTDGTAA